MIRVVCCIAALCLFLPVCIPPLAAQEFPFRHFTTQSEVNPLPKPAVTAVYQDRQGYVWLGSYGIGLVRYDGQQMETYSVEDSVETRIFGITEDGAGRLWIIGDDGVSASERPLADYAPGERIRFTTHLGGTPLFRARFNLAANAIVTDRNGDVWVGSHTHGVIRYREEDSDALVADTVDTGLDTDSTAVEVLAIAARKDGTVWASLRGGRLFVFEDGSLHPTTIEPEDAPCALVDAMAEDATGAMWFVCGTGDVRRLAGQVGQAEYDTLEAPVAGFVTSMAEASPGKLWMGTLGSGVVEIDTAFPYERSTIGRENGLLDVNIWGLLKDREGNVWVAQNSGLSRVRANYRAFAYYTGHSSTGQRPVLPATDVIAIRPDVSIGSGASGGSILVVGTSDGLALIRQDGEIDHLTVAQGLPSSAVLGTCTDASGRLWLTTRLGATSLSGRQAGPVPPGATDQRQVHLLGQPLTLANYDLGTVVSSCSPIALPRAPDVGERVPGVCFSSIPILCRLDGEWYAFGRSTGLTDDEFWRVAADSAGYLYVGSKRSGLYRSRFPVSMASLRDSVERRPESPLRPLVVTRRVFELVADSTGKSLAPGDINTIIFHDGVTWVSGSDEVMALEGWPLGVTTRLGPEQGVGPSAFSLAFAPMTKTLWAASSSGLAEIDPERRTVLRTVTKQDGLLDNETWGLDDVAVGKDGTVYHGTASGLSLYRPHLDQKSDVRPLLALREASLTQDGTGHNEFNVRFAALSFGDEKRVRYKTRLAGFDEAWSAETSEASIRYMNLPALFFPRTYTFEVMASNSDGYWTEQPLAYSFSIVPALWLRWWAFLAYAILLSGGVYAVHHVQRRRVIRKEREQASIRENQLRAEAAEHLANFLQVDNDRKTRELEQARRLQLSMLPRSIPVHPVVEAAASMQTATEVGGDYYDFTLADDGTLTFAIGDATGHGVAAGTMVTAVKSLWNAFSRETDLEEIMRRSNTVLRGMHLPKLYMALAFGRVRGNHVELIGAGMPPALIYRAESGDVEEVPLKGLPLGSPGEWPYRAQRVLLRRGDMIVLMSDGFPELKDESGEMLGYAQMADEVIAAAGRPAEEVVAHLTRRVKALCGGDAPDDDVTFVVIRAKTHADAGTEGGRVDRDPSAQPLGDGPGTWPDEVSDARVQEAPRTIPVVSKIRDFRSHMPE